MKLHVFHLGDMNMDKSLLINMATVATRQDPNCPAIFASFSVISFLMEHSEGLILFDAGCHPNAMGDDGHWTEFQQNHFPLSAAPEENLITQLEKLGHKPEDIRHVILSHMHNDHAGCLEYFTNASIYVHENEFSAAMRTYARRDTNTPYVLKDIDSWLGKGLDWKFIRSEQGDIPFMDGITILNFGSGHAAGMLGLEVNLLNYGTMLLVSDSIYCQENFFPKFSPLGIAFDSAGARATLDRIYWLSKQKKAMVFFGHDSEQVKELRFAPSAYYD